MCEYKWQLRKGSKKDICPACGRRSFVPYVSASDGKTIAGEQYGRCERINHCQYVAYPNGVEKEVQPIDRSNEPKPVPMRISSSLVDLMQTNMPFNTLYRYFVSLFGEPKATDVCKAYRLGTSAQGGTIFWQINRANDVHAGKIIYYQQNGHRNKGIFPPVQWVHKIKGAEPYVQGDTLEQCFFGEHLTDDRTKPIAICESEKTAMAMSVYEPNFIWLASGGATNLRNKMQRYCLRGRVVWLFPDNGQYYAWKLIASDKGWQISDFCEKQSVFDGCDILDIYEQKQHEKI